IVDRRIDHLTFEELLVVEVLVSLVVLFVAWHVRQNYVPERQSASAFRPLIRRPVRAGLPDGLARRGRRGARSSPSRALGSGRPRPWSAPCWRSGSCRGGR